MTTGGGGAQGALVESFERRRRHPTHDLEASAAAAWADLVVSGASLLPEAVRLDDAVELHDLGGDTHSGSFPVLVTWPDGESWIHKPRSSWQEALVGELLEATGRALGLPWPRPEIRSDGSRSWVRPSKHLPVADLDGVREFFRASGVLLAVAQVLRLGDLNHENIIASGARPVVVDAELLCRPGPPRLVAPAVRPARAAFESSALGTLLLPLTADPAEPSGLGVAAASRAPDGSRRPSQHLPVLDGRRRTASGFVAEVVDGYTAAYAVLPDLLPLVEERLLAHRAEEVRVLLRPTIAYEQPLTWLARQRVRPTDRVALREDLVRRLRNDLDDRGLYVHPRGADGYAPAPDPDDDQLRRAVCVAEAVELEDGDIPCFAVGLTGRDLRSAGGTVVADMWDRSPLQEWRQHSEHMCTMGGVDAGVEHIRRSLGLHAAHG